MSYGEKLRDPRWQRRRLEIFQRDSWACRCCGAKDRMLAVHHRYYVGEPWEAPDEALETLCQDCHDAEHDKENERAAVEELLNEAVRLAVFLRDKREVLEVTRAEALTLVESLTDLVVKAAVKV
jgi:phage terminase large subunit GpA-like protein